MAEPPVAFAVKATVAVVPVPKSVAVPIVGACGTVVAVIDEDAELAVDVPPALVAVAVKVYEVALCNPVTVTGEDAPVPVKLPGALVTV